MQQSTVSTKRVKKKVVWPSLEDKNPLTWRCKRFGCKDEPLPLTFVEHKEKHGVRFGKYTAVTMAITYSYHGCTRCHNYKSFIEKEEQTFPVYRCYCDICEYGDRKEIIIDR